MNSLADETSFFHDIAAKVTTLVASSEQTVLHNHKGAGDYSIKLDHDVENLIIKELGMRFAGDSILSEEAYADVKISDGRIWIIDPICGTRNVARGINNFCTNIALAHNHQLIASCVIDHSNGEYIWSVGSGKIYIGKSLYQPAEPVGTKIDVDFGSVRHVSHDQRKKYNNFLSRVIEDTGIDMISLNTSLSVAYCAIGKIDGIVGMFNNAWDACAGTFLIQQAGGVVTNLDGSLWNLESGEMLAGRTPEVHQQLLGLYAGS